MPEEHRTKIANSKILNRLIEHAEGKNEMKPAEIRAALGLLDRVLPKLQAVQHSGDIENPLEFVAKIELTAPDDYRKD